MTGTTLQDTIVAVASPPGRGAVGIVRLSGDQAREIGDRLFRGRRAFADAPFRALHGTLVRPGTDEPLDEVLALFFPTPRSFTGEDVVEIHCHGAPVVLQQVVQAAIGLGARAALPGEFTMRAFLNGRINLTQAEGIRDLIDAQTTFQAQLALRQTQGAFSRRLQPAKEELLHLIVHLESSVEFVEENLDTADRRELIDRLDRLDRDLRALADTYRAGHLVREGLQLAVIGRPNVGKSSLFNTLLDSDRAIVTDVPGTTRDTLTETVAIGGVPVKLVDTAGIRDATDAVERIGIERSYAALAEADVVLLVVDATAGIVPDEEPLFDLLRDRRALVALNKTDLPNDAAPIRAELDRRGLPGVAVSARTRAGVTELQQAIWKIGSGADLDGRQDMLVTDARHAEGLARTVAALSGARASLEAGYSEEVPLADLHLALSALGEITGEVTVEQIFDRIFATFCIGK